MDTNRFLMLARTYGGRIERWPVSEQAAARRLLHTKPAFRAVLHAEAEFDAALDQWKPMLPSSHNMQRVIAALQPVQRSISVRVRWFGILGMMLGLSAAGLAGLNVGAAVIAHMDLDISVFNLAGDTFSQGEAEAPL